MRITSIDARHGRSARAVSARVRLRPFANLWSRPSRWQEWRSLSSVRIVTVQDVPQFRHQGLPYESSELLLEQVTGFLGPALDREEPVLIAAQSDTLSGFQTAFIGNRSHIDLAPMEEVGRNPGRLISVWSDFLDRHRAEGRTVWGIGEPIYAGTRPGRDRRERDIRAVVKRGVHRTGVHPLSRMPV